MDNQQVKLLRYNLETVPSNLFKKPKAVHFEHQNFGLHLEGGILKCKPKRDYNEVSKARNDIEPYLRSWEIDFGLKQGRRTISFEFSKAELIRPVENNTHVQRVTVEVSDFETSVSVSFHDYPDPPQNFVASQDVKTLWYRYKSFLDGSERLMPMAYFCLTVLTYKASSRENAAKQLNVAPDILNKIGEISSTRGSGRTARKYGSLTPATEQERVWLQKAVKKLIRRAGERDVSADMEKIEMNDLPKIK